MLQPYQLKQHAAMRKKQGDPLLGALGTMAGTAAGAAIGGPPGAAIGGGIGSQLGNVASGAPLDPAQMAISGIGAGIAAGSSAANTAVKGVTSAQEGVLTASNALEAAVSDQATTAAQSAAQSGYDEAIKKLQDAGMKSMEAESSLFNNPFSKAGTAIKSVFMSEGGEVNPNEERKRRLAMVSPLMALSSSSNPLSLVSPLAAVTLSQGGEVRNKQLPDDIDFSKLQQLPESERNQQASVDQQTKRTAKKSKGPLCSDCKAQYKACGGMTKKY
jgi:hypothetical protein